MPTGLQGRAGRTRGSLPRPLPEPLPGPLPMPLHRLAPPEGRSRGGAGGRKGQGRAGRTKPGGRRGPWRAGAGAVSRRDGAGGGAGLGAVPAVPGPGGAQPALRSAAAPEPGAAGQHPQRAPAHHHPHGHLCLPARPAAVAERDPPGHRGNAASHLVLPPGIHHPSTASVLPVLPSGTHAPGAAPDPPGSPVRYPPSQHGSGPARFSPPVPAVLPLLPSAAGDALRMRAWLFTHPCPCCITWLHRDVASNKGLAGCWKSPPPSASRLLELLGVCPQQTRLAWSGVWSKAPSSQIAAFWRG